MDIFRLLAIRQKKKFVVEIYMTILFLDFFMLNFHIFSIIKYKPKVGGHTVNIIKIENLNSRPESVSSYIFCTLTISNSGHVD